MQIRPIIIGRGERALVVIAGMSLAGLSGQEAALAEGFADLARDHTVLVYDRAPGLPRGYTVEEMARDVAEDLIARGIAGADVFGASQGGMIAIVLAARWPELCRRVVLASSYPRGNAVSRAVFSAWAELADRGDCRAILHDFYTRAFTPAYYAKYRDVFTALEAQDLTAACSQFAILCRACLAFDGTALLPQISCPVLVLGAEEDAVLGAEGSRQLAEALRCPLYLYPGYGHAVYDEAPDFRARIADYFRR